MTRWASPSSTSGSLRQVWSGSSRTTRSPRLATVEATMATPRRHLWPPTRPRCVVARASRHLFARRRASARPELPRSPTRHARRRPDVSPRQMVSVATAISRRDNRTTRRSVQLAGCAGALIPCGAARPLLCRLHSQLGQGGKHGAIAQQHWHSRENQPTLATAWPRRTAIRPNRVERDAAADAHACRLGPHLAEGTPSRERIPLPPAGGTAQQRAFVPSGRSPRIGAEERGGMDAHGNS